MSGVASSAVQSALELASGILNMVQLLHEAAAEQGHGSDEAFVSQAAPLTAALEAAEKSPPGGSAALELVQRVQPLLAPAAALAPLLREHWAQPEQAAADRLALARAAAARSCAYLRCANLGGEGGPAAGQGVGSQRCSALERSTSDAPSAAHRLDAEQQLAPTSGGSASASGGGAAPAASADGFPVTASIHDLPDELLSRCLVEAGRQCGRPAAVSRRFRRLYLGAPVLWREITIEPGPNVVRLGVWGLTAWRLAKATLLRRTAGMARSVSLRSAGPEPGEPPGMWQLVGAAMGSLLGSLPSPALESLDIRVWQLAVDGPPGAALASLPALKKLCIGPNIGTRDEAGLFNLSFLAGPLPGLAQLEDLHLMGQSLPLSVAAALSSLRQLSALRIATAQPLPNGLAGSLQEHRLPALQVLVLQEARSTAEGMVMPVPHFALEALAYLEFGASRIQVPAIPGHSNVATSWPRGGQEGHVSLQMYECTCCNGRTVTLGAVCMPHSAPLLSLVWAVGAGTGQMNHLELNDCHLTAAAVRITLPPSAPEHLHTFAFRRLRALVLSDCWPVDAEAEGLGEALSLAPHLTSLSMNDCNLAQLPAGPYLAGLESLSTCGNSLTSLPPALAAASRLTGLDLSGNPLEFSPSAEAVLLSLAALGDLGLWLTPVDAEALSSLRQSAPHLHIRTTHPSSEEEEDS
ncbi:L domain [Chlorella sorokiniana]|uniref:L domain n=1 Tax=Chlorella sorokiniana TaxID=3076 RepID=A0A2P6TRD4_CHLSO|nr:L domain [Chlorella sorokiniana]|eukprot:PRW56618.1 L domain [Chlorella sorokiniana]